MVRVVPDGRIKSGRGIFPGTGYVYVICCGGGAEKRESGGVIRFAHWTSAGKYRTPFGG